MIAMLPWLITASVIGNAGAADVPASAELVKTLALGAAAPTFTVRQ
ncbi:MAG: hypothetical protein WAW79_09330 [Steroidobacteraceae bacterium]